MTTRVIGDPCPGTGLQVEFHSFRTGQRRTCPACNLEVSVTSYGFLRKHSKAVVRIRQNVIQRRKQEEGTPTPEPANEISLLEMRDEATRMKLQLWIKLQRTKDPRYHRLHQFANMLEQKLAELRDEEMMARATRTMPK